MFKTIIVIASLAFASVTTYAEGAFDCILVDQHGVAHDSDWMMKFERGARLVATENCEAANPNEKFVCDEVHRISMTCVFDPYY